MHELSIAQNVVEAVCERADGRRVRSVRMVVGALCAVVPDSMHFCFELAATGTAAEGARLDLETPAGVGHCRQCGADLALTDPILLCPCGSSDVEVRSGRELTIVSMEVS
ncbi:hydrogenase maturation nickel metallochaperone HypA [Rhodococcus zopfii]|uniref:hydrogenase maturation nickel metallochaperone HypA n=1 Tax=Rhodococcus zopfii TaxID=43772 RepID=UPI0011113404|nr:hydrogenase maturation nickel metallochaperone HypA [Rhodococcus zopfii]